LFDPQKGLWINSLKRNNSRHSGGPAPGPGQRRDGAAGPNKFWRRGASHRRIGPLWRPSLSSPLRTAHSMWAPKTSIWTSSVEPEAVPFFFEFRVLDARASREAWSGFVDVSGLRLPLPPGAQNLARRVTAVARGSADYSVSGWSVFRVAPLQDAYLVAKLIDWRPARRWKRLPPTRTLAGAPRKAPGKNRSARRSRPSPETSSIGQTAPAGSPDR
jgi:hypothetical protein